MNGSKTRIAFLILLIAGVATASTADMRTFTRRGQVLLATGRRPQLVVIYDGTTSTPVLNELGENACCRIGDLVEVEGHEDLSENANAHKRFADVIRVTGNRPLPEAPEVSGLQIVHGEIRYRPICVKGVIMAVERDEIDPTWIWFLLGTPTAKIRVATPIHLHPTESLEALIDADVRLYGVANWLQPWHGRKEGHLILCGTNAISVLKPPTAPENAIPFSDDYALHRRAFRGTVYGRTRQQVFIRNEREQLLVATVRENDARPAIGTVVRAVGFAEQGQGFLEMSDARLFTLETPKDMPKDIPVTSPEQMFVYRHGGLVMNFDYYGQVVRLQGRVLQRMKTDDEMIFDVEGHLVRVDATGLGSPLPDVFAEGARVDVTGLCIADFASEQGAVIFPEFRGFALVPRTAEDLRVLEPPPQATPLRLLVVILVLTTALTAILVRNRQLHRKSTFRKKRFEEERIAHLRAEVKVEERTRLAIELHDSISQTLTGVALLVDSVAKDDGLSDTRLRQLGTAQQMLSSCRRELQGCLWDLRTRTFEEKDLTEAIERTIEPHLCESEATVRFNVPRSGVSETTAHTILRIVRELVVNAVRHGHARHIWIAGESHDETISFSVRDNGTGFDLASVAGPREGHFGLQGIRERLGAFEGTIRAEKAPDTGMKFLVTMKPRT